MRGDNMRRGVVCKYLGRALQAMPPWPAPSAQTWTESCAAVDRCQSR